MKKYLTIIAMAFTIFIISTQANAHVRWFVNANDTIARNFEFDMMIGIILTGVLGFIIIALFLDTLGHEDSKFTKIIHSPFKLPIHAEWQLVSIAVGAMLLMSSYGGHLLAPNLKPNTSLLSNTAMILQLVVGFLLISQLSYVLSALGLAALAFLCLVIFPIELMMDYLFEFGAVIIALYLIGPTVSRIDALIWKPKDWHEQAAVCAITVGLGLQLIELATHNKLTNPGLVLEFVDSNSYLNFILMMGMDSFTNMHFSFAGGITELAFGILLVLGISLRFTGLAIIAIFSISAAIFGVEEFFGHLPIIAVSFLIILHGNQGNLITFLAGFRPRQHQLIMETI